MEENEGLLSQWNLFKIPIFRIIYSIGICGIIDKIILKL